MDINFRKLEPSDTADDFDCGDDSLNEYLRRYAVRDRRRMFGVTYVAVCHQPKRIIGYFTLANTSIPREGLPEELLKGLPKYQGLPAFLLGRLAVDKHLHGKGIGELLLSHCLEYCLVIAKCSGARYLIADVKPDAVGWYERYNFREIKGGRTAAWKKMFLDLKVANSAIDHRAAANASNMH